ncbi:MAG: hypothetical protein FJ398_22385 [Verrucomicrobia bacterium]|nr:hypothetical protein [Verrucomicrobiota bacterium]
MTTVARTKRCDSKGGATSGLRFFIAYENIEMGLQALQLYQRVARRFGQEHRFQLDLWKFEALGVPSLDKHAAEEAAAADLVIVAANRDDRVPLDLRIWVEQWTDRKIGKECVLVFLSEHSHSAPDGAAPLHTFLRDVASQNLMTFLSDSVGTGCD